jgi:hypothetical protein
LDAEHVLQGHGQPGKSTERRALPAFIIDGAGLFESGSFIDKEKSPDLVIALADRFKKLAGQGFGAYLALSQGSQQVDDGAVNHGLIRIALA